MDWLAVSTILSQASGTKPVSSDIGCGLVLIPILMQAPEWLKKFL
jgi:hypothetical protein